MRTLAPFLWYMIAVISLVVIALLQTFRFL